MPNGKPLSGLMKLDFTGHVSICVQDMTVDAYSEPTKGHLPSKVKMKVIGPLPNGSFNLVAIGGGHHWLTGHYNLATPTGANTYFLKDVPVKGPQHPGMLTPHDYTMQVDDWDDEGCPTGLTIICVTPHFLALHIGAQGDQDVDIEPKHLGSVHLSP